MIVDLSIGFTDVRVGRVGVRIVACGFEHECKLYLRSYPFLVCSLFKFGSETEGAFYILPLVITAISTLLRHLSSSH